MIRFADDPQEYRVDDTRAALVAVGDSLTVKCIRRWQYAATHGYECRWVGVERTPRDV